MSQLNSYAGLTIRLIVHDVLLRRAFFLRGYFVKGNEGIQVGPADSGGDEPGDGLSEQGYEVV